jgi:hypothetical protein
MKPKYRIKIKTTDGKIRTYEAYDAGWWDRYYRIKLANEILYFPVYSIVWVSKSKEKIESEEEPVNLEKEI